MFEDGQRALRGMKHAPLMQHDMALLAKGAIDRTFGVVAGRNAPKVQKSSVCFYLFLLFVFIFSFWAATPCACGISRLLTEPCCAISWPEVGRPTPRIFAPFVRIRHRQTKPAAAPRRRAAQNGHGKLNFQLACISVFFIGSSIISLVVRYHSVSEIAPTIPENIFEVALTVFLTLSFLHAASVWFARHRHARQLSAVSLMQSLASSYFYATERFGLAPGELSAMTDDDGRNADAGDADVRDSRCGF